MKLVTSKCNGTNAVIDIYFNEAEVTEPIVDLVKDYNICFDDVGYVYINNGRKDILVLCCQDTYNCLCKCEKFKDHSCPLYK